MIPVDPLRYFIILCSALSRRKNRYVAGTKVFQNGGMYPTTFMYLRNTHQAPNLPFISPRGHTEELVWYSTQRLLPVPACPRWSSVQLNFPAVPSAFAAWPPPGVLSEIQEPSVSGLEEFERIVVRRRKAGGKETKSQAAFGLLIHSVVLSFIMTFYYIAAAPPLR